ncbi:COX6B-domain-containing protein [Pseudovirgaria hyperparasitica]|uniref:COX6B-domain-containing protein n=1 Tax=Pseudovirgaria hyperparasitica TaxID=470096 RepID=A0A6A6WJ20_9PEZI|nr:COX6B-domain-containing protein [Pseudovirgaria hyperparasitica]KAF2762126.1 COX6B-domain-containing protein [Pseudovirgaria hyperparasitica]
MSDDEERVTKPFMFVTGLLSRQYSTTVLMFTTTNDLIDISPVRTRIQTNPPPRIGFDARFPNQNQTKHCWQNYVDYFKCINAKGEDFKPCRQVHIPLVVSSMPIAPYVLALGMKDGMSSVVQNGTFPARLDE